MLARRSSFLKNKLLFLIASLTLTCTPCRASAIWGLPSDQFGERLRNGDFSFLRDLEPGEQEEVEAFRLGPGAPYYLHFIFMELGLETRARRMLQLQWSQGSGVWKEKAGLLLLGQLQAEGDYVELERRSGEVLRGLSHPGHRLEAQRLLLEALFRQGKDAELLRLLSEYESAGGAPSPELKLYRAISSCRLERPGWQGLFNSLFREGRSSEAQARALSFLEQEDRTGQFDPLELDFFRIRSLLSGGRAAEALPLAEAALPKLPASLLAGSSLIAEVGSAYFSAQDPAKGADYLLGLAEGFPQTAGQSAISRLPAAARLTALEMAGRLYRSQDQGAKAWELLDRVRAETQDPAQKDRVCWFLLDLARKGSGRPFLEELEGTVKTWYNPWYFSELLEEEISARVAAGRWDEVHRLYLVLRESVLETISSRLSYLEARLVSLGLIAAEAGAGDPEKLFQEAIAREPLGYYAWLSEAFLGRGVSRPSGADRILPPSERVSSFQAEDSEWERFVWGFFEFGLPGRGYEELQSHRSLVGEALKLRAAAELKARGYFLESIRLTAAYLGGKKAQRTLQELELLYPLGYGEDIRRLSGREGIPEEVLFALVREESHFDPRIVSHAGAVGLTQLMPETAAEVAGQMRLEAGDLKDPRLNLEIGISHFSSLLSRLGSIPKALLAYNAGFSRLRGWESDLSGLPGDLLVEAVPFRESRHYVRKILVSAIFYASIYRQRQPEETVGLFYPRVIALESGT